MLGVARTASAEELKAAYSAILKDERAKIAAGEGNPDFLAEARAAYATLRDPIKRAAHNALLASAVRAIAEQPLKSALRAHPAEPPPRRNFFARAWRRK